ncbi:MAG TPA: cobalamin-binding protein [Candidatus Limnocylindria bacterium]|nr:cobalamin-binding protein [Candidatus Limnocylindria bacterium]
MPSRIVSLSPSNTEILCALGLGPRLVGVDDWSDHPEEVRTLPRVGRDLDVDVARVAALRPDLVVACLSVPGMERNVERLRAAGLPFIVVDSAGLDGLDGVFDNILRIGDATARGSEAATLVADLRARMERVASRVAARAVARPRVYWEWYPKPLVAAAGRSWITRMLAMAGADNVFADRDTESAKVTMEEVAERRPEVLVACWCGARTQPTPARIAARDGWDGVPAILDGRVHVVPETLFGRPGPRLAEGLELLADLLHTDAASESSA